MGGPANLAKSMVVDYLAGDEFTTINKQMITDLTAMLHDTDSELVNNVLNNKQAIPLWLTKAWKAKFIAITISQIKNKLMKKTYKQ